MCSFDDVEFWLKKREVEGNVLKDKNLLLLGFHYEPSRNFGSYNFWAKTKGE